MISNGTSGTFSEDAVPPGGLVIMATIAVIMNSIATEAAAEEIEPTYYFRPAPGCIGPAYLHVGEYVACIGQTFFVDHAPDNAQALLWAALGLSYRRNPALGFSLAVVSTIFIEALAIRVAAECRQDAIHCDMRQN